MKIHSLTTGAVGYSRVKEKQDGRSTGQQQDQGQSSNQEQSGQKEKHEPQGEVTAEQLGLAVQAFQADTQTQANGLNASLTGMGPGLKVVLKDVSGSVVRQYSGEEFLRLREATAQGGQVRGKILDQKL